MTRPHITDHAWEVRYGLTWPGFFPGILPHGARGFATEAEAQAWVGSGEWMGLIGPDRCAPENAYKVALYRQKQSRGGSSRTRSPERFEP